MVIDRCVAGMDSCIHSMHNALKTSGQQKNTSLQLLPKVLLCFANAACISILQLRKMSLHLETPRIKVHAWATKLTYWMMLRYLRQFWKFPDSLYCSNSFSKGCTALTPDVQYCCWSIRMVCTSFALLRQFAAHMLLDCYVMRWRNQCWQKHQAHALDLLQDTAQWSLMPACKHLPERTLHFASNDTLAVWACPSLPIGQIRSWKIACRHQTVPAEL